MQSGQALIVVLLILGVVATLGLSVVTRSVTEVRESTVHEESARALEAAEVGLERYLAGIGPTPGVLTQVDVGGSANYALGDVASIGTSNVYKIPFVMENGDTATVDLGGWGGSSITICWGWTTNPMPTSLPAIVVMIYYKVGDEVKMQMRGYDTVGSRRGPAGTTQGFYPATASNSTCGTSNPTVSYLYNKTINLNNEAGNSGHFPIRNTTPPGVPLFMRIKMLFSYRGTGASTVSFPQPVAVSVGGPGNLPVQAGQVESVGSSGDSVQKIKAVVPNYDMPGMFDFAIFSGTSLTK